MMLPTLLKKQIEAKRLLETYGLYKDSQDEWLRRKVHVDLDRFLMENREIAILCLVQVLGEEIDKGRLSKLAKPAKRSWLPKWLKRDGGDHNARQSFTRDA